MRILSMIASLFVVAGPKANAQPEEGPWSMSLPTPNKTYFVEGGGNVSLAVQEWGNHEGVPVIFVHAFSQSHLSWLPQITGGLSADHRLITFDNRGHGNSEKPAGMEPYMDGDLMEPYMDGDLFAHDLQAVIEGSGAKKPVLVGWSIGGVLTGDYISKYGDEALGGVLFVCAAHKLSADGQYFGDAFAAHGPGMMSDDLATNVASTIAAGKAITAEPIDPDLFTFIIATNMVVPHYVRAGMSSRSVDHFETTLPSISVPVRLVHGAFDRIVAADSSREAHRRIANSTLTILDGVGHAPNAEAPDVFERELRQLTGVN